jgi:aminoglycoside phosphotransferase (APT) family kinase protein
MIEKNNIINLNLWIKNNTKLDVNLIELKKFDVGQSNPTYLMKTDKQNYVIRSKPLGNLLKGAHRIDREYKVMSALENSRIPVPKMHAYCEDTSIIGTEFYIMDFLLGNHEFDPYLPNYKVEQKKQIYNQKVSILSELTSIDIKKIGLETFGKPKGYLERQIELWINQYRNSQTRDIGSMEYLIQNIPRNIPAEIDLLPPCLLHGDFRLDNMMLDKEKVIGLLDWELSTIAPPFIDLSYWALMLRFEKDWPIRGLGNYEQLISNSGIPSEESILEKYLNLTGLDKPKYWKFLLAFNSFRFAGILQGIAKRVIDGNNAGNNGYEVGEQTESVATLGSEILKETF